MTGDELEVRVRGKRRDTRRVTVRGGLIERADQRLSLGIAHSGMIEPVDATKRRQHGGNRPLTLLGIGDRKVRDVSGSVVPGKHRIARSLPTIIAGVVGERKRVHQRPPPVDGGVGIDRLELDDASHRAGTTARHGERDRRDVTVVGQDKGKVVELATLERVGRATLVGRQAGA